MANGVTLQQTAIPDASCDAIAEILLQWNLSKTATCEPVIIGLNREVATLQRQAAVL